MKTSNLWQFKNFLFFHPALWILFMTKQASIQCSVLWGMQLFSVNKSKWFIIFTQPNKLKYKDTIYYEAKSKSRTWFNALQCMDCTSCYSKVLTLTPRTRNENSTLVVRSGLPTNPSLVSRTSSQQQLFL